MYKLFVYHPGIIENRAPKEIPKPFAKALFWPEEVRRKKIKRTAKVPSVATSDEWQNYHRIKDEEKRAKLQEKEERLGKRIQIREEKKIQEAQKKQVKEDKKKCR